MKPLNKILLLGFLLLALAGAFYLGRLATFPGRITSPDHRPVIAGERATFRGAVCYRHPGAAPRLEIAGSHYEMGVQYGVLLRPEILRALTDYEAVLRHTARREGVPFRLLTALLNYRTARMAQRLPARFREEMRGVAEGAGLREQAVVAVSLLYDVLMTGGCTGVLMRGADGGVIHGHNQEPYGFGFGGLLGKHTVVVRRRPTGYHAFTQIDPPLFLGVETGYNERGLAYTEETYSIRRPNRAGFPIVYLARLALEEAATLEEVGRLMENYAVAAPGGMLWSDRDAGRGMRLELLPTARAAQPFEGPILWDFNNIVDPELARQQTARSNLAGFNRDRRRVATAFPEQPFYAVAEAVAFLRSRQSPDGSDYSWRGTRSAIANAWGQQLVVFDPGGDGFYLALGETFAAVRAVYHYPDDFSLPPAPFLPAVPLAEVVEEAARLGTGLLSEAERLQGYLELAEKYPDDANVHFLAAHESFRQEQWESFLPYAMEAYRLAPEVPEYGLYAGMAAYREGWFETTIERLEGIGHNGELSPEQELYRLTVLAAAWEQVDPGAAERCRADVRDLLAAHGAGEYYDSAILPIVQLLVKGK